MTFYKEYNRVYQLHCYQLHWMWMRFFRCLQDVVPFTSVETKVDVSMMTLRTTNFRGPD